MLSVRPALDAYCPPFLNRWKESILNSPVSYRLARGAFWSLVGSLISRGLGMIAGIVVARILGKNDFGQLGMVQSTVGMFGIFAGFGMGLTANKHVGEFKAVDSARAGRVIGLCSVVSWATSGLMALGLFFSAPWLAGTSLADPGMEPLLRIGSLVLLFSGVNGAQTGALAGFEAFKAIARVNLLAGFLAFPVTLVCAFYGGVFGSVWALVINMAANCILNYLALREEAKKSGIPLGYGDCMSEWPIIWQFSLPAVLSGAVAGPVTWATNALLVNQANGYAQMGVYNAVYRIRVVPEMILSMLLAPLLPILSEKFSSGDSRSFRKAACSAFTIALLTTAPVALIQIAIPALTLAPYGKAFAGNGLVVQWMMTDLAIIGVFIPIGQLVASMNRMWFGLVYQAAFVSALLVLSLYLVPKYGAVGLAASITLSHLVILIPSIWYVHRIARNYVAGIGMWELGAVLPIIASLVFLAANRLPAVGSGFIAIALFPALWWVQKRSAT